MVSRFLYEMWDWKTFAAAIATVLVVVSCWFAVADELEDRETAAAYARTLKERDTERARSSKEITDLRDRVDVLIRYIQESGGTVPVEMLNGSITTTRRGGSNSSDDDDDDGGGSVTVNNPPRVGENPAPKGPENPPESPPPNTVEDLTKNVEDTVGDATNITDLIGDPLNMGG